MCECRELVQYGSWTGACDNEIACSVLVCGSVYRGVHVRESVPQYGPRPPGLCTSCTSAQCEPSRALYSVLVLAPQGFVLLCTSVRHEPKRALCGANLQGRYTVCWYSPTNFVPSAYELVRICTVRARKGLCFCVQYDPQELCAVRAYKGFIQCVGARPPGLCTPCLCAHAVV